MLLLMLSLAVTLASPQLTMGFDQNRTVHHFLLRSNGGVIQVEVKDPGDGTNRMAIRAHLRTIALEFAAGRFDAPLATHGEEPPGTSVMRDLRGSIRYLAEDTDNGARLRLISNDPRAVAAIREFLVYQIREHRTGDPTQ
ncbi:MAG TPA: hypothetical protein VGF24_09910 [Vicinamibacterales bacterium]|jgi:hypothetical protein